MVSEMLRNTICPNGPFTIGIVIPECKDIQGFVIWHGFGWLGCAMLCCCGFTGRLQPFPARVSRHCGLGDPVRASRFPQHGTNDAFFKFWSC